VLRIALMGLALALPSASIASESRVTGADVAEIRAVIQRQIDAVRRDDCAVQRPASLLFLGPVVMSGDVVQPVRIVDRAGGVWLAYYAMQRQEDGSWRTHACHLVQPARTISAMLRQSASRHCSAGARRTMSCT